MEDSIITVEKNALEIQKSTKWFMIFSLSVLLIAFYFENEYATYASIILSFTSWLHFSQEVRNLNFESKLIFKTHKAKK